MEDALFLENTEEFEITYTSLKCKNGTRSYEGQCLTSTGLRGEAQLPVLSCVASQPLWFIRCLFFTPTGMESLSGSETLVRKWEVWVRKWEIFVRKWDVSQEV